MAKQAHDYTKWHKAREARPLDLMCSPIFDDYDAAPIFILGESVTDLTTNEKENESIKLIADVIGFNLPFTHIVYETMMGLRMFVCVTQIATNFFRFHGVMYSPDEHVIQTQFTELELTFKDGKWVITNPDDYWHIPDTEYEPGKWSSYHGFYRLLCGGLIEKLTVLLNTKGVEQQKIEPAQGLNRSRTRKGKRAIPPVILIKATHYFDKSGKRHDIDRNSPRLHWRRGHMRGVWTGPRDGERKLEQRYIFPCLVNYQEGDNLPEHRVRVIN